MLPLSTNLLLFCWPTAVVSAPIAPADILETDLANGRMVVGWLSSEPLPEATWLLLAAGTRPVGRFRLTDQHPGQAAFAHPGPLLAASSADDLQAWLIAPDLVAHLVPHWPADADLNARLEGAGPGARSAWIRAGANQGIRPGMTWWQRIGGQPVARYDVRHVEPAICFCAAVPLAADISIRGGEQVALWPSPGQRRRGAAQSAVAFVERSGDATVAWLAAPVGVVGPREAHIDFYRGGQYVAYGVVEGGDELFWYARLVAAAPASQPASATPPTSAPSALASQPASSPATALAPVQVGDTASIRTSADIARRRFAAHVFELSAGGALITAGEVDGLRPGDIGRLYRAGVPQGRVSVRRVQSGYSIVTPLGDDPDTEPALGAEVRFAAPPPAPTTLAEIERVVDGTLFVARLLPGEDPLLLTPLAVCSGGQTVGVAVLVAGEGGRAWGFAVDCSLTAALRSGAVLVRSGAPED